MSIFQTIKYLLKNNVDTSDAFNLNTECDSLTFNVRNYGEAISVLNYLKEQGVFRITHFETNQVGKRLQVYIEYKKLDVNNSFFKYSNIKGRNKELKQQEIENNGVYKHYSTGRTDQRSLYENKDKYEYMDIFDSCTMQLVLDELYDEYIESMKELFEIIVQETKEEFIERLCKYDSEGVRDLINEKIILAKEYIEGEEDENLEEVEI